MWDNKIEKQGQRIRLTIGDSVGLRAQPGPRFFSNVITDEPPVPVQISRIEPEAKLLPPMV